MERAQQLIIFCDETGKAITFFDGKFTLSQLLMMVGLIIFVFSAIRFVKGIIRTILLVVGICGGLVYFGFASPTQLKDVTTKLAENGVAAYTTLVNASDNIRIENNSIDIKLKEKWYNITSVKSFVQTADGVATVNVDGTDIVVSDSDVVSLLNAFK